MKWLSKLKKLKLKLDFHREYARHWWTMSDIIIEGLIKLIKKEEDLINKNNYEDWKS